MAVTSPVFYLIPGLGADERVFQGLQLVGEVHVLRWLPVQPLNEALAPYAARLSAGVPANQACWLVGVSFGGVLALEVAKLRPLARVVLISSLATADELPWPARVARATGLHRVLPTRVLQLMPRVAQWFFSVSNGAEYKLLRQIIRDTDPGFAHWAVGQLVHWQSEARPPTARIHGTHDRLLPAGATKSQHLLAGGHFIIVSQAVKISRILNQLAATASAAAPAQSVTH